MVTHKMCHQHCHQIDHELRWITKLITKFVTKFVTKHPGGPICLLPLASYNPNFSFYWLRYSLYDGQKSFWVIRQINKMPSLGRPFCTPLSKASQIKYWIYVSFKSTHHCWVRARQSFTKILQCCWNKLRKEIGWKCHKMRTLCDECQDCPLGDNTEAGNSEFISDQDCPP